MFCSEVFGRGGKDKDGFKTEHHRDSGQTSLHCSDEDAHSLRTNFKGLKFQTCNIKSRRLKPGSRIDELNGGKVCVSDRESKTVTSYFMLKSEEDDETNIIIPFRRQEVESRQREAASSRMNLRGGKSVKVGQSGSSSGKT